MLLQITEQLPDRRLKIKEVSLMLGIAIPTIYSRISREPHKLPVITNFKDGARGFLLSDVLAWLHAERKLNCDPGGEAERRGPGRPRNSGTRGAK